MDHATRGYLAQQTGQSAEQLFDVSAGHYKRHLQAHPQTNYPEIKVLGRGRVKIVGKGVGDRTFAIKALNGRSCHLEIKTWQAKNQHKMSFRGREGFKLNAQYQWLYDSILFNALAYYIVLWRHNQEMQWRLHKVNQIAPLADGLQFVREEGLFVPAPNDWPDWLPVVIDSESTAKRATPTGG